MVVNPCILGIVGEHVVGDFEKVLYLGFSMQMCVYIYER